MVLLTAVLLMVAPWVFILGPLALLLLLSRPRTRGEWLSIAITTVFLASSLRMPASLSVKIAHAGGVFFVGAFVIMALIGVRSLFNRAFTALLVAVAATVGWCMSFGIRYSDVQAELVAQAWRMARFLIDGLPESPANPDTVVVTTGPLGDLIQQISQSVTSAGMFYPAELAILALGGAWLSWVWYHRLARTPMGVPAGPFRTFRFNDHLVWVLVVLAAAALTRTSDTVQLIVTNALLVILFLYAARGLAVVQSAMFKASMFVKVVLVLLSLIPPVLLLSVGGCTFLGVADTWVDFRRRMAPATGAIP